LRWIVLRDGADGKPARRQKRHQEPGPE
jgi:hypothetical protein